MKKILVGFDGSEGSENALNKAMMLIDENGVLILLAVVPIPSDKNLVDQTAYELLKKKAYNLINTVVNDIGSHEYEITGMVEEGDIAAKIIDVANDLIARIMSTLSEEEHEQLQKLLRALLQKAAEELHLEIGPPPGCSTCKVATPVVE